MYNGRSIKRRRIKYLCQIGFIIFVIIGVSRVIWINNKFKRVSEDVALGEDVYINNLCITANEACLLSKVEYAKKFNIDANNIDIYSDKYVCVQLTIRNVSNSNVLLGDIGTEIGVGFETDTWASVYNAQQGGLINIYKKESIEPEESITMWMVTGINKKCFKNKTWKKISINDFRFVLSLEPLSVKVKL